MYKYIFIYNAKKHCMICPNDYIPILFAGHPFTSCQNVEQVKDPQQTQYSIQIPQFF